MKTICLEPFEISRIGNVGIYEYAQQEFNFNAEITDMELIPLNIEDKTVVYGINIKDWEYNGNFDFDFDHFTEIEPHSELDKDYIYKALGYGSKEIGCMSCEESNLFKIEIGFILEGELKSYTNHSDKKSNDLVHRINTGELEFNDAHKVVELVKNGKIELQNNLQITGHINVQLFNKEEKPIEFYMPEENHKSLGEILKINHEKMGKWIINVSKDEYKKTDTSKSIQDCLKDYKTPKQDLVC